LTTIGGGNLTGVGLHKRNYLCLQRLEGEKIIRGGKKQPRNCPVNSEKRTGKTEQVG